MSTFAYRAYGLDVRSELRLPELMEGGDGTDLAIRRGTVDRTPFEVTSVGTRFRTADAEVCLIYAGAAAFSIRAGRELVVAAEPALRERALRLLVLGPALAVLLHQRHRLVLHASAVAIQRRVVAFLGGSGWGKSTSAAAMHRAGHEMVVDDVMAVDLRDEQPIVWPGFPQLKLWPDAATALGEDPASLPLLRPEVEKRARHIAERFAAEPLQLERVYVLSDAPTSGIDSLSPQSGLVELVRHSYAARLLPRLGATEHFQQCATLVRRVAVRRLMRPRSLAQLSDLVRLVEEDVLA